MHVILLCQKLKTMPLLFAYVLFPLSNQVAQLVGIELYRNWIDLAWLFSIALALTLRPLPLTSWVPPHWRATAWVAGLATSSLAIVSVGLHQYPAATVLMETKPVIYAFGAVLLMNRFGVPSRREFARYGAVLAGLLCCEMMIRSIVEGRLERPVGSGEVNYDAALLCMSLLLAITDRSTKPYLQHFIFLGVLSSLSRTGILAAMLVLLMTSQSAVWFKATMAALAAIGISASFVTRGLELDVLEGMDRFWMWTTASSHFLDNWTITAVPARFGGPVDVDLPFALSELWTEQQEKISVDGIYAFHFHAMWLRLALSWGWLITGAALLLIAFQFVVSLQNSDARTKGAFALLTLVLGLTMGLVYLSNVGVVFFLAMARALSNNRDDAKHAMQLTDVSLAAR